MSGQSERNEGDLLFPGKIAIVTDRPSVSTDDFHSADRLIEKYGADKIIHNTWPENFTAEREKMIDTVVKLADDREVKALIFNQAIVGTNAAVDRFKELRDDVFIIYCFTQETAVDSAARANLIFRLDSPGIGMAVVKQAKKQGAKVFVHYSFPRHMAIEALIIRRDKIREACAAEGIQFVDAAVLDPAGEAGAAGARRFILEDVPKLAAGFGENTAFYTTNCTLQAPLIRAVVDCHAIFPQPCCPSPFHGFPEALGIKTDGGQADLNYVISEACRIAEEKNMSDRLSTWPVSASMMFANTGAEYAIKWINGKVPKNPIDDRVLKDCLSAYVKEVVGEGVEVEMSSYSGNGIVYDKIKLILMGYLDF